MKMQKSLILILILAALQVTAQPFNGLHTHMGNLYRLSDAVSRSISPENITGEKGKGGMTPLAEGSARHAARDLGLGWKVNPYFVVPADTTSSSRYYYSFGRYRRSGSDPANLDDPDRPLASLDSAHLLG